MSRLPRSFGPRPRDELAQWSTAELAPDAVPPAPGYPDESPAGHVVSVRGQDVLVRRTAGPPTGPDAWYIHGLDGASNNWDRLAAVLQGYSTGYAPDLPGSGRSAPPADGNYGITHEADLCAELIERVSTGPVHLVGNSRGGIVATFLAARHPDLVRTLTLISPAVPDLRLAGERGADPRLALVMVPGVGAWASRSLAAVGPADRARGLAHICFGEPERLTAADLAAAEREFRVRSTMPWIPVAAVKSLQSLIRAQLRPGRWSFEAASRSIRVPVLVVWGTRDRLVDARLARRTARGFADARLLMLPRTGHVAQMERPRAVARAMLGLWRAAGDLAGGTERTTADELGAPRRAIPSVVAP